jgi:cytoskeleton protein RodZ
MASRRKRNLQFLPAESRSAAALDINALPIDIGVGELMRLTRERLGQELQTVANQLRIRLGYLEAIEEGRFRDLPGSTYAVGFVRSYADYLGLDSGDIVRRFREEAARIHGTTKLVFPALTSEGKVPRAAVLLVSALGLAVAYGGWYYLSSRDSVQLPLIAEVPDRLVALPPDAGAPPLPQPQANPTAPAVGANAAPVPADASPPAPTGSAIAAPAVPSQQTAPPAEGNPTVAPSGSASAAVPNETGPDLPPASDTSAASAGAPASPPSDSAAGASGAVPPNAGSQVTNPVGAAAAGATAPPAPAPTVPPSAASGAPVAANDANGIPVAPAAPTAENSVPTQEAALPADAPKGIVLEARIDSWIKIADGTGKVVFSQILRAGDHYALPDQPGLVLDTGNAGGLDVIVNGSKAPALGEVGAVRHRIVMDPARLLDGTAASN